MSDTYTILKRVVEGVYGCSLRELLPTERKKDMIEIGMSVRVTSQVNGIERSSKRGSHKSGLTRFYRKTPLTS
jgi:hypothetical protein